MGIRSFLAAPIASWVAANTRKWSSQPGLFQQRTFERIVSKASNTRFGREHDFASIRTVEDFKKRVPIRDYEGLKSWFDLLLEGGPDILWPGKPVYFAKTSGTTSGTKYIPITSASLPNHFRSARNAVLSYVHETGNKSFLDGGLIFLSGSPVLIFKIPIHDFPNSPVPSYSSPL